jgi:phosphate-selective porin
LRTLLLITLLLAPGFLFAQNNSDESVPDEDEPVASSTHPLWLSLKNRPSFRFGEFANVDIRAKWHLDWRAFDPPKWEAPAQVTALPSTPPTFYLTRARFGLKGDVTKRISYEVERDMRETFGSDHEWHPWKDNYADVTVTKWLQIRAGKMKMPFGMEANLSEDRLDFAFKSRVSDVLSPARERGVVVHSQFLRALRMQYQAGVFRYDGEGTDIHGVPTGKRTYAARVDGEPIRRVRPLPRTIRHMYLGVAMTRGEMFDGLNSVHGSTFSNFTYFDHEYVHGNRTRIGAEGSWVEGPVTIKGEYIHMSEERLKQGIHGEDLPDLISRGWYILGGWNLLGKMKSSGKPKNPFLIKHGFGTVAVSGRYDVLMFYSAPGPGLPTRSPRAPTVLPNGERSWTFGPTWYLNRFMKIEAHAQHEHLVDIERKAVFGINNFWTGILRLQLAM